LESFLYSLDVAVFRFVNETLSSPSLDAFFSYITNFRNAGILTVIILFIFYQLVWGGAKGRWLVLSLAVAITLSDQGSSHLLKYWFQRVRPCNALPGVLTPAGGSSAFSFPSSHAANMGSSMFLLARNLPTFKWLFIWIALMVGLSRIYLGLHYPSDVLGGYLFGVGIGWVVWKFFGKLRAFFQPKPVRVPLEAPVVSPIVKKRIRKKVSRARKKR
jgi:undecaprenyl-diphosphatase